MVRFTFYPSRPIRKRKKTLTTTDVGSAVELSDKQTFGRRTSATGIRSRYNGRYPNKTVYRHTHTFEDDATVGHVMYYPLKALDNNRKLTQSEGGRGVLSFCRQFFFVVLS